MKIVREERETHPVQMKFASARREMGEALIERDSEIDLVLTGLVARENVLLVGPPGCAKSLLLDALMSWMKGRKFSILLNRFTTPEEGAPFHG
jgi:MoxR-like ATPase